jgi:tetratricopeptide (TPR) repeat protein
MTNTSEPFLAMLDSEPDPARRISLLRDRLSLAQQQELLGPEVELLRRLANAYQDLNRLGLAHRYRSAAIELIERHPEEIDLAIQAYVEGDLGRTDYETGKLDDAERHFARALELAERAAELQSVCTMRYNLLLCRVGRGHRADADRTASIILHEAASIELHSIAALTHLLLAQLAVSEGRLNESHRHARKALSHAERSDDSVLESRLRAEAQATIGQAYYAAGLATGDEEYILEAERRFGRLRSSSARVAPGVREAELETEWGRMLELKGRLPEALLHYQLALDAWEEVRRGLSYEEFQASYPEGGAPLRARGRPQVASRECRWRFRSGGAAAQPPAAGPGRRSARLGGDARR